MTALASPRPYARRPATARSATGGAWGLMLDVKPADRFILPPPPVLTKSHADRMVEAALGAVERA